MNFADHDNKARETTLQSEIDAEGYAVLPGLLSENECRALIEHYDDGSTGYRSVIDMARYNFGQGEYRYFDHPLPKIVSQLRSTLYPTLARIANTWEEQLGQAPTWPDDLETLLQRCHAAGQRRPTPLILRYHESDYNCLHQDLYGEIHFPLQVAILLSRPGVDFTGGELVLVEQRPRMQSRPMVVHLNQGDAAVIPVRERPREGRRGYHRVQMRHGVARINSGERLTLGIIFHDAT